MGLFSFGKKKEKGKEKEIFRFVVHDIFTIKNKEGIIVTGLALNGEISVGESLICIDNREEPQFICQLIGIEQPGNQTNTASAYNKGKYGANYGLWIKGVTKEEIPIGAFLVSKSEKLERSLGK